MPQVIQTTKSKSKLFSILHRGHEEYSSDPYSNNLKKATYGKFVGRSKQTLGTSISSTRCSSTLDFLFGKESLTKKTSNENKSEVNSDLFSDYSLKFNHYIKNNRNIRLAGISASFLLLIISALTIYPIIRNSNNAEAATPVAADTVLTFTSSLSSANLNLVVKSNDGTFASSSDSESSKFSITTNNYTGYTLSITGPENTDLTNEDTNKVFTSIDSNIDAYTFTNGSGDLYNGKYGYLPSKYNSSVNTYFRPAPTETATTLDETSSANQESNNYSIALGARADYSTPNGVYSNTFILTLVANNIPYTLNFTDTTGDSSVSNLPTSPVSGETADTKIALPTNMPTRTGYTFAGWCDVEPTAGTGDNYGSTVCINSEGESGNVHNPSTETTTSYYNFIDQTASSNISTLYTLWTINTYDVTVNFSGEGISSIVFAPTNESDSSLPTRTITTSGTTANLTYNIPYTVTMNLTNTDDYEFESWALNDGSYGALTNTDTNPTSFTPNINSNSAVITATAKKTSWGYIQDMTATTCQSLATDAPLSVTDKRDDNIYTIRYINGSCWMTQNLRFTGTNLTTELTNIDMNKTITYGDLASGNSYDEARIHDSGNTTTGVWYNYAAASAMTIAGSSNSAANVYNVCPKGWTLPTYDQAKTIGTGDGAYVSVFKPITGGTYSNGSPATTDRGYWLTRIADGTANRYNLRFDGTNLSVTGNYPRFNGYYIRCIAKTIVDELEEGSLTMQYIGGLSSTDKSSLLSAMTTGTAYDVIDSRDNQVYKIAKLADGKVWMANNLNLGATTLSTDLTSSNTNVASTVTASTFNGWKKSSGSGTYTSAEYIPVSGTDSTSGTAYGTLYNYCAASAGTICVSSTTDSMDFSHDLCPKGWRLPIGGPSGEFQTLYNVSYNSYDKLRASIARGGAGFSLAGIFGDSTPNRQGYDAHYLSSTMQSTTLIHVFGFSNAYYVYPAGNLYRNYAGSIRCVLK